MSETEPAVPEPTTTEPVLDLHLQMLAQLLGQELRSTLPVTLNVPAGLVHGELISHEAWKAAWAQDLHGISGDGARMMSVFPETVDQGVAEVGGAGTARLLPRWLHLRDAVFLGGAAARVALPLWRARLADVSGWALGRPTA
jgi:hypothetical protein